MLIHYVNLFENYNEFFSHEQRSWKFFDKDFFYNFISIYSLNPVNKIYFYTTNGLLLEYLLNIIVILFNIQLIKKILSFINVNYSFKQNKQLFLGIVLIISAYSFTNVPLDARIFLTFLTPFFLFLDKTFTSFRVLLGFIIVLSIPLIIKLLFLLYSGVIVSF